MSSAAHYAQGGVLVASGPAPGDTNLRQTVAIRRSPDGTARVHVETYHPTEWDTEVEDFHIDLPDLDAALAWLASNRGVRADDLRPLERRQP